jgi:hypothetical protein
MKAAQLLASMGICFGLLFSTTSCVVVHKHDNGKHKGWYKNPKNPHHPSNTKTTGNGNGNNNGKKK